ncbi:unnamed protein product [Cuscuta europaea]|uniref:Uncharacterized protein n=1 Tax=Cuscuta europaea TaxID=41803 RepID=A0A9P1EB94_CUSEU|nr:unnamed protein product [Cuscuta europaea]
MSFLSAAVAPPRFAVVRSAVSRSRRRRNSNNADKAKQISNPTEHSNAGISMTKSSSGFGSGKKITVWKCVQNCGACCKLDKGQNFPSPEEIFDDPSDIQLYKSLVGEDGWCIHYEKSTRMCSRYAERPYFCRVEPEIFEALYGIDKKKFNKEACSCCIDTIKAVHGSSSTELDRFNLAIRSSSST